MFCCELLVYQRCCDSHQKPEVVESQPRLIRKLRPEFTYFQTKLRVPTWFEFVPNRSKSSDDSEERSTKLALESPRHKGRAWISWNWRNLENDHYSKFVISHLIALSNFLALLWFSASSSLDDHNFSPSDSEGKLALLRAKFLEQEFEELNFCIFF